ncbi:MAG: DNA polymerase/3'-5' exonuclease PolX [Planctomycetota bacterium]
MSQRMPAVDNLQIARVFEELAELMEFRGENPFRIRAYQNGARAIRDLDESVASILADESRDLAKVPGIGKTLVEKCAVLIQTGNLPQLTKLQMEIPEIVILMSRIPGLGAKKAMRLHDELAIQSLDDLRAACTEDKISGLKGFGKKTQDSIFEGLAIAQAASERLYWSKGDELASRISSHMDSCVAIRRKQWAGSYRRGRETVGDLDLLVVVNEEQNRNDVMDHFEAYPETSQVIGRGDTKISIRVDRAFQVDMRVVLEDEFGAALQYFTGSQAHNVHVRRLAKERGLKINEYGVFRESDSAKIAGTTEEDVYDAIGLPWIPPELREDRQEFLWATDGDLPELIKTDDVRGDLHMHTTATDGQASMRQMADEAIARGLQYIAITDHSQRVSMANGLDPNRLRAQWQEIDQLRSEYEGRLMILKGIECDILESGGMDLPDDVLAEGDWIIASIHYGQKQPRDQITERILGAIENPHVDCVAHPTGRLINRRPPYDVDLETVMRSAAEHSTFMELNANPARLDLNDVQLATAKKIGVSLVINTDAHSTEGLSVMRYGILQARRGGLKPADVKNCMDWRDFSKLIAFST